MTKRIRERVQVGMDANGKPIYEWATGHTRQEVFESALEILQKYNQAKPATETKEAPTAPYFETYLEEWWKLYKQPKLRHTTLSTYRNLIDNHILPHFRRMRLNEIKVNSLQKFYNDRSHMAQASVKQMARILHQIFEMAIEDGYMTFNPTKSKRLFIKGTTHKREALTGEEVRSLMSDLYLLEGDDRLLLAVLLYTGMRRGEAIGLRWEDIDWKRRLIAIERAVTYQNNRPVIGEPKSEAGKRQVPLDDRLADVLKPHRQLNGFILGEGVRPLTEKQFTRTWQRMNRTINLFGATPHVFRHTYITLAVSSGIDVKTLQAIAGHADVQMTLGRYSHKREEKVIEAGELIGRVFSAL